MMKSATINDICWVINKRRIWYRLKPTITHYAVKCMIKNRRSFQRVWLWIALRLQKWCISKIYCSWITLVRVECSKTTGSYYNGKLFHTLYEFPLDLPPGDAFQNTPKNVIFMPLNTKEINNITLTICDQDDDLENFRGENIVVRLELKKV